MSQPPNNSIEQLQRQLQAQQAHTVKFEKLVSTSSSDNTRHDATLAGGAALQRRRTNVGHGLTATSSIMAARQQRGTFPQQSTISQSMRRTVSNRSESAMASLDRPYAPQESPTARRLARVSEYSAIPDVGMNPDDYLANARSNEQSYLASTGVGFSAPEIYSNFAPSAPPSMISASTGAEIPLPMTRENSSFENLSGVGMARLASLRSQGTDGFSGHDALVPLDNKLHLDWKNSDPSNDLFAIGFNLSPPPALQQYIFSAENTRLLLSPGSVTMERSESSTSAKSTISIVSTGERRAKEARERHLQNSRARIAPRPQQATTNRPPAGVAAGNRDARAALNRARYQRPKRPKVQCTMCDDHPEFRGDHELRRHINAKHEGVVKKFICRDPASVGMPSSLRVLYPLSRCKACSSQKQYGAYYNAAAHLRRTHFRPKPPRGKSKVPLEQRRGGKGGGDSPPMKELKMWFEEVRVHVDRTGALDADNDAAEDEAMEAEVNDLDAPMDLFSATNGFGDYDMSFVQDYSATPVLANADGTMMGPLSAGSMEFDYLARYNQPAAEFMMSEPNDGTYAGAAPTNSLTPPTFPGLGSLNMTDDMFDVNIASF